MLQRAALSQNPLNFAIRARKKAFKEAQQQPPPPMAALQQNAADDAHENNEEESKLDTARVPLRVMGLASGR